MSSNRVASFRVTAFSTEPRRALQGYIRDNKSVSIRPKRQYCREHVMAEVRSSLASNGKADWDIVVETSKRAMMVAMASTTMMMMSIDGGLAKAAMCPSFSTAPDGLQWCDITVGKGDEPVKGAFIKAHYSGSLDSENVSGTFDSSYDRGRPLGFSVGSGQVIKGWDEGILGGNGIEPMKYGGKRKLVIPPELGYGSRGAGGVIPPNATLYFDVELVGRVGQK